MLAEIMVVERSLELMCKRLMIRVAFGKEIARHNVWQQRIAGGDRDDQGGGEHV